MLRTACNNKRGLTIVEVLITLFLTAVGIMSLMSMQSQSWKAASRSDFMGRAAGILHSELERNEIWIMNPNNVFVAECDPSGRNLFLGTCTRTSYASSQSTQQAGDVPFTVKTIIVPSGVTGIAWTADVQVTWPGNTNGVREIAVIARQDTFK